MSYTPFTRDQIAERAAQDIPDGAYVNLGIGLPTKIAKYLPEDKDVFLHSENGLLAFGPPPAKGQEDPELINAEDSIGWLPIHLAAVNGSAKSIDLLYIIISFPRHIKGNLGRNYSKTAVSNLFAN